MAPLSYPWVIPCNYSIIVENNKTLNAKDHRQQKGFLAFHEQTNGLALTVYKCLNKQWVIKSFILKAGVKGISAYATSKFVRQKMTWELCLMEGTQDTTFSTYRIVPQDEDDGPELINQLDTFATKGVIDALEDGRTHRGKIQTSSGGVGRNMAEALSKLGHDPFLITTIGEDAFGRTLLDHFQSCNMDIGGIAISKNATPIYSAILNRGRECLFGIGDMTLHAQISVQLVSRHIEEIKSASIVIIDGNLPVETIEMTMRLCSQYGIPLWFEPTEVRKASKILQVPREFWSSLKFLSPNLKELESLTAFLPRSPAEEKVDGQGGESQVSQDDIKRILSASFAQFTGLGLLLLTCGKKGFIVAHRGKGQSSSDFSLYHFPSPAIRPEEIQSVSGAGDCLNAGFISGLLGGLTLEEAGTKASECARDSLESIHNVPLVFSSSSK